MGNTEDLIRDFEVQRIIYGLRGMTVAQATEHIDQMICRLRAALLARVEPEPLPPVGERAFPEVQDPGLENINRSLMLIAERSTQHLVVCNAARYLPLGSPGCICVVVNKKDVIGEVGS